MPATDHLEKLHTMFPVDLGETYACGVPTDVFGMLTQQGLNQLRRVGENLRNEVIIQHGLLSDAPKKGEVSVRSTFYRRTVQSTQSLLSGLYPEEKGERVVNVKVYNSKQLIPDTDFMTKRQVALEEAFWRREDVRALEFDRQKVREFVHDYLVNNVVCRESFPDTLSWNRMFDILFCFRTYGIYPPELQPSVLSDMEAYCAHRMWSLYGSSSELAHLAIGELIEDLLEAFIAVTERRPNSYKLRVFSAHDSSLIATAAALMLRRSSSEVSFFWPDYASTIKLELFEDPNPKTQHERWLVRFRFNDDEFRSALTESREGLVSFHEFVNAWRQRTKDIVAVLNN
jgi:hypothetical protein